MFLQPDWWDPTQPGVGTNRFSYCGGNPTNCSDPSGHKELTDPSKYGEVQTKGKGDWYRYERVGNLPGWKSANSYNLQQKQGHKEYTTIEQRSAFYDWYQSEATKRGDKIKWPGAARDTANAVDDGTLVMFGKADEFLRTGNRIIFDNVFPKLRERMNSAPLTGSTARAWDTKVLAEEQRLVQGLYDAAKAGGYYSSLNRAATWDGIYALTNPGLHFLGIGVPAMTGELSSFQDRFYYGMSRMGYRSDGGFVAPRTDQAYTDGSLFSGYVN